MPHVWYLTLGSERPDVGYFSLPPQTAASPKRGPSNCKRLERGSYFDVHGSNCNECVPLPSLPHVNSLHKLHTCHGGAWGNNRSLSPPSPRPLASRFCCRKGKVKSKLEAHPQLPYSFCCCLGGRRAVKYATLRIPRSPLPPASRFCCRQGRVKSKLEAPSQIPYSLCCCLGGRRSVKSATLRTPRSPPPLANRFCCRQGKVRSEMEAPSQLPYNFCCCLGSSRSVRSVTLQTLR